MRIDRLDLLAYGHYKGATLDVSEPDAGLTIVCGPNEAGKSTARRALLAALWGIPRATPDAYVHGRAGLRIGALVRTAEGEVLHFVRQGLAASPFVDAHGTAMDADAVSRLVDGVGPDLYSRLFCVDHEELRLGSGGLLDAGGEIGRLLFGASLGSGSVTAALRRLDERADVLYKERGSTQRVAVSLKRYDEANRHARERRVRSRDWDRRQQEMSRAEARVGDLQTVLEEYRAQLSRLERVRNALPLVAQRSDLIRQSSGLRAEGPVAPRDWAERAAAARERHAASSREHAERVAQRTSLQQRIEEKKVDDGVLDRGPGIDDLVQGIDRYKKDAADLPKRQSELSEACKRLDRIAARLGLEHDDGRVVWEADLVAVQELAQRRAALEAGVEAASRELEAVDSAIATERRRLGSLPDPPEVSELERALSLARPELARAERLLAEREAITG
ncbi:MAG: AAA family ATPase, partial [Solirubrobacteraceae bacterium]